MFFSHKILTLILILLTVASCSRPMTEGEIAYANEFFTKGVDFGEIRFSGQQEKGVREAERLLALEVLGAEGSEQAVERLISGLPSLFGADAFVVGNNVYFDTEVYSSDFSTSIFDSDRWLMAHEITHVWQWQNRDVTGYSFAKVISEHLDFGEDVYEYTLVNGKRFTEYRFEQQGRIVQCYAMLRQLTPNAPLTARHERLIRSEFPLEALLELIDLDGDGVARVREEINRSSCDGL